MGLDTGHSPCERVSVGHRTVYVGHPHELASPHACLSVISKAENVYLLPFHEFPGTIGKRTSRRPVAPRRPPLMNSPFVPSVARCESAEGEQKRQVAAARCVIQAANVALYLRDAVLRRTSYGQNRAMRRPSIAPTRNSTKRDATQACSSHVSTQGFCTTVRGGGALSGHSNGRALEAVLGSANPVVPKTVPKTNRVSFA